MPKQSQSLTVNLKEAITETVRKAQPSYLPGIDCPAFPGTFGSLQDARAFCGVFFTYYNHEHRHSGIGLHTPYSVHIGTAAAIQDRRQAVLNAACAANPRRFTRRPRAPKMPVTAWINKPFTEAPPAQGGSLGNSRTLCLI